MNGAITASNYQNGTSAGAGQDIAILRHRHELEHEIRRLRRENTELRKRLRFDSQPSRIARRAREDALAIVTDLHTGLDVAMAAMEARRGMSRRRWEWARAILRMADCTNLRYQLKVMDPAEVERRLSQAVERIIEGQHLRDLEGHLPPSRRRERWNF